MIRFVISKSSRSFGATVNSLIAAAASPPAAVGLQFAVVLTKNTIAPNKMADLQKYQRNPRASSAASPEKGSPTAVGSAVLTKNTIAPINMADPPKYQRSPRPYSSASPEKASHRATTSTSRSNKCSSAAASKEVFSFTLGDPARPSDVNIFRSVDEHVAAVEQLKEGGYCFILRSDFRFTYALVLKKEDGILSLQVNEEGCTKSIPEDHWKKYIRTLITTTSPKKQHPDGGNHEEGRHRREQQSHRRSVTASSQERPPPPRRSTLTNSLTKGSKSRSVSKKDYAPVSYRRSFPETSNQSKHAFYKRTQSENTDHDRSTSSGSDDSSSGGDDRHHATMRSSLRKFSFATESSKRSSSSEEYVPKKQSKQVTTRHTRRVTIGSQDFKRSVSIQEEAPLKNKYCKHGHHERAKSECDQFKVSQSGCDNFSASSSLDSFTDSDDDDSDDSSLQEDFNKLLTKSMPSMKQTMAEQNLLHGAFGAVTKIEVLD